MVNTSCCTRASWRFRVLDERVGDVAEGPEHHLLVLEHRALRDRPGGVDAGADATRVEDRQRERRADREQPLRAEGLAVHGDAADPGRAGQEDPREEVGFRDADARGRRGELLLGRAHVGSTLEQARREPGGQRTQRDLRAEGTAARHRTRAADRGGC